VLPIAVFALVLNVPTLLAGQATNEKRTFSSVRRMLIQRDNLIWLDEERKALYRLRLSDNSESHPSSSKRLTTSPELLWLASDSDGPTDIAADDSFIYISDRKARAILRFSPDGSLKKLFSIEPLQTPSGIAVWGDKLYVSDVGARKILTFDLKTGKLLGESTAKSGGMPNKLRYLAGELFGVNFDERTAFRFTLADLPLETDSPPGQTSSSFIRSQELDLTHNVANVTDFDVANNVLYCLDSEKRSLFMLPLEGAAPVLFKYSNYVQAPTAVAVDGKNIYLADDASGSFVQLPLLLPATIFFEGRNAQENFVNYLKLLQGTGLLPLREYVLRPGETLDKTAAELGLLSEQSRAQYRALLCELNRDICARTENEQRQVVNLPSLNVKRYYASLPINLQGQPTKPLTADQNDTVEVVSRKLIGSEVSRVDLDKLLVEMNQDYEGPDILNARNGYFLVPSVAYSVSGTIPLSVLIERAKNLTTDLWRDTVVSVPYSVRPQSLPNTEKIPPNLHSERADTACDGVAPDFCHVLDLVKYNIPDEARTNPFALVVVDRNFDPRHPAFKITDQESALSVYRAPGRPPDRPSDTDDTVVRKDFDEKSDHGNHVSALIGARPIKDQMQGIKPSTLIYGVTLGDFKNALEVDEKSDLRGLRLFNLSIGEDRAEPDRDIQFSPIKTYMLKHSESLFVVAAGNDSMGIPPEGIASKGYLDNVIVVGATETIGDEPGLMPTSNFDDKLVSVVAPGRNVRSALAGSNFNFGTSSGTSQACPIVAGTAAILMSLENDWEPWKVKQRIVATANLNNWADGNQNDKVLAGMLDIKRAVLDRNNVVVVDEVRNEAGEKQLTEVKGIILDNFLNSKKITLRMRDDLDEPEITIAYRNLLRVKRSKKDNNKRIVIFAMPETIAVGEGAKRKNRRLRREVVNSADILGDRVFTLIVTPQRPSDAGKRVEYDLREIEDFINR
jgi:hypothetical protein